MLRDRNHAELGHLSGRWLRWKSQVCLDHVFKLLFRLLHGLVNDNPVHSATEVEINLLKDSGCINPSSVTAFIVFGGLDLLLEIASGQSHLNYSVLLL